MFSPELLAQFSKLKEQSEESKERLANLLITEEAGGGLIRVTLNGNREMKGLEINSELASIDKDDLEDLLLVAFTRALERVNAINEQEVMASAQKLFPGF